MLIPLFYTLNVLLLLSGLASIRFTSGERNFSIALLRCLTGLPLLAGEYFILPTTLSHRSHNWFFSQKLFSLFSGSVSPFIYAILQIQRKTNHIAIGSLKSQQRAFYQSSRPRKPLKYYSTPEFHVTVILRKQPRDE